MTERIVASVAFAFLVAGLLNRKNRRLHVTLMGTGIGIDTAAYAAALTVQTQAVTSSTIHGRSRANVPDHGKRPHRTQEIPSRSRCGRWSRRSRPKNTLNHQKMISP